MHICNAISNVRCAEPVKQLATTDLIEWTHDEPVGNPRSGSRIERVSQIRSASTTELMVENPQPGIGHARGKNWAMARFEPVAEHCVQTLDAEGGSMVDCRSGLDAGRVV